MGGFFKPKREETGRRTVRPAPEQTLWAQYILPTSMATLAAYQPWMMGMPTEIERYWLTQSRRLWQETLPSALSKAEELYRRAEEIEPIDLTASYLEQLQRGFERAIQDTIKKVSSSFAARGGLYGTPLRTATDEALARTAETFAREYARAAMTTPEIYLRAEELRRSYLLPYLKYQFTPFEIMPRLAGIELTPEERRRQFFLNLLRGIYTLSPYQTTVQYELTPSPFTRFLQLAGLAGEIGTGIASALAAGNLADALAGLGTTDGGVEGAIGGEAIVPILG